MSQFFNGKLYIEPGADVTIDFDSTPKVSSLSASVALVIGESERGLDFSDKKVYAFQTSTTAKSILGSGPALDLINCLFNPSPDFSGASQVLFVRSNKGTNAQFKTATGTVLQKSTYTITGDTENGRVGFDLSIAGGYPRTVYADITKDLASALKELAKLVDEFDGVTASATATEITIEAAHNAIEFAITNPLNPGTATAVVATSVAYAPVFDEKAFKLTTKDKGRNLTYAFKRSGDVFTFYKDGGILTVLQGIGSTSQLVDAVNNNVILSRVLVASAENLESVLPTTGTVSPLPLTTKPNVPTTFDSFQEALSLTYDKSKNFVLTHFEGAAYHAAILDYCVNQSTYKCMGFGGGSLNEAPSAVMDRAFNLNSEKFVLCYPGVYLTLTGEAKLYPPSYLAALCAGLACGLQCQEPLTRKILSCQGFEDIDLEGMDFKGVREELINSGVLFCYSMDEIGNVVNKGINTVQGQVNRQILEVDDRTHEISIARIRNQMTNEIRVSANKAFPGHTRLYPSKNDVMEFYRSYFNSKIGTYLTGWDDKSLTVWVEEDAWFGSATLYVNGPINHSFTILSFKLDDSI